MPCAVTAYSQHSTHDWQSDVTLSICPLAKVNLGIKMYHMRLPCSGISPNVRKSLVSKAVCSGIKSINASLYLCIMQSV